MSEVEITDAHEIQIILHLFSRVTNFSKHFSSRFEETSASSYHGEHQ